MDINSDAIKKEIYEKIPDLKRLKANPNHLPIIDKWNSRILKRCKFSLFDFIIGEIDKMVEVKLNEFFR